MARDGFAGLRLRLDPGHSVTRGPAHVHESRRQQSRSRCEQLRWSYSRAPPRGESVARPCCRSPTAVPEVGSRSEICNKADPVLSSHAPHPSTKDPSLSREGSRHTTEGSTLTTEESTSRTKDERLPKEGRRHPAKGFMLPRRPRPYDDPRAFFTPFAESSCPRTPNT